MNTRCKNIVEVYRYKMKVIKFGGSSLASAAQLLKVLGIVKADSSRKFVVVSAPGKRFDEDVKVTDLLIAYFQAVSNNQVFSEIAHTIFGRFSDIFKELNLKDALVLDEIHEEIFKLPSLKYADKRFVYDAFLATGENCNAKLIAAFFKENGLDAQYIHPSVAGLFVSEEPANARVLEKSYTELARLRKKEGIFVIPGFFGVTEKGMTCTFSRGGSDITGSIVAAGVGADEYENFTDVDGIFAAHPGIVHDPKTIKELTFREMRELAYAGFSVLHDEALYPAFRADVPVVIKNTNNPTHEGTVILPTHVHDQPAVVGIASDDGFSILNISKYLMNREIGFGRRVLSALEELEIPYEHMPSGIDNISVVLRKEFVSGEKESLILARLQEELSPDEIYFEHDLSMIMIVGERMKEHIGVVARATAALSIQRIHLNVLNQGASEVSTMFAVASKNEHRAVRALYETFFYY